MKLRWQRFVKPEIDGGPSLQYNTHKSGNVNRTSTIVINIIT